MVERAFEIELDRLFAESPPLADADRFVQAVTLRLERGWTFRRFLIGGLGIAGGLIGGAQVLGSGLLGRLTAAGVRSDDAANHFIAARLSDSPAARGLSDLVAAGSSMDGQVLWMSAALAVLAIGLFLTRAVREI